MKNKHLQYLVQGAMIAALYIVVNYTEELIFPGFTTMSVQFRVAEALCMLACLTPAAIPGLTLGCFIANFISVGFMPIDLVVGTLASFLAALTMYALRNVKLFNMPILAALMPAVFNGVLVGLELTIFVIDGGFTVGAFLLTGASVALGELVVVFALGLPLYTALKRTRIFSSERTRSTAAAFDVHYLLSMLIPPAGLVTGIVLLAKRGETAAIGKRCVILSLVSAAVITGVVFGVIYFLSHA